MRSAVLRCAACVLVLSFPAVVASAQQPGLTAGSGEETSPLDLDHDGLPQEYELRLAQHFFPTVWYDSGEDTSSPGGNHDHRENHQPGRLLFRVRPHPHSPSHVAITYALLYRVDGGEGVAGITGACHLGDVEPFAITLRPDPSCALGYAIESIRTWAHGSESGTRPVSGCNWGFSRGAVSHTDFVLASENKHGNYLTDSTCDSGLLGAENCDTDWTAGDVNAWRGLNVGEWSAPFPFVGRRHADLSPLGFDGRLWENDGFCGGPHSGSDWFHLGACFFQPGCPAGPPEGKFTDEFVAPVLSSPPPPPPPPPAPGYVGCFTDEESRALPHWLGFVGDVETCVALAAAHGRAYAGLQWHGECWGGDAARYTQVADGECSTLCASGQPCGGAWRNSVYATGVAVPPPGGGGMQADSAVRGCAGWSWWAPVHQPDPGSCHAYCTQNGADACEWFENGDCYVEFGSGCHVEGGFPGWWAAVD